MYGYLTQNMANFSILMKQVLMLILITLLYFISPRVMATDENFCTDYVLTSIEQYWRSVNSACGFTGKRWNSNYRGQYNWCLSAYRWVAENEIREREALLQQCIVKSSHQQVSSTDVEFLRAIKANNVKKAKQLVKEGADINVKTQNMALIKELGMHYQRYDQSTIENKTAMTAKGVQSFPMAESALSFAVSEGLVDTGMWLLNKKKKILTKQKYQYYRSVLLGNALINAVKQENSELVLDVLNKGANINYELDGNNGSALYFALVQGSQKLARLLLDKQANSNYTRNAGESLLNIVLNDPILLELLLQYNADPNSNGESVDKRLLPIMKAVEANNVKAVDLLMQYGASADVYDYDVPYPLITAIKGEQIIMIRVLLKHNVNVNVIYNETSPGDCVQGEKNNSPFSVSVETKNKEVIRLLTRAKSKPIDVLCPSLK